MSDQWRPFEPSREECTRALLHDDLERGIVKLPPYCNRHVDCDEADARARLAGRYRADHCHDECCEECFGS